MSAIAAAAGMDRVLGIALSEQRQIEDGLMRVAKATGKHPVQVVCVADFLGLEWRRGMRSVKPFLALSRILDDHFPERLHVAVVARAPRLFTGIYSLASPFLAADTKAKVRIFGHNDDHLGTLTEFITIDNIPQFLKGDTEVVLTKQDEGSAEHGLTCDETPTTSAVLAPAPAPGQ